MHKSWRGASEWRNENLSLYTGCEETCKLYDASISQLVGWYSDPQLGGLENTIPKLLESDPNFVMGHVLAISLKLVGSGSTMGKDPALEATLNELLKLADNQSNYLSIREKKHVSAVNYLCHGQETKAAFEWEGILTEYPTDMLAIKLSNMSYLMRGMKKGLRDSVASLIPRWKPSTPLYGYLYGMYAFGLEESCMYEKAEKMAYKGLAINPKDAWSTHALGHVYEMEGRATEGINFLNETVNDWVTCDKLAGHNYWHLALYHIERSEYDAALEILETQIKSRLNTPMDFIEIINYSSLLYRLNLEGLDVSKYWDKVAQLCMPHLDGHGSVFVDMHLMMSYIGSGDDVTCQKFMDTLMEYIKEDDGDNVQTSREIGVTTMNALLAANEQRHADVVESLYPIHHKLYEMGGSDAQRDVLNILLISSALKSKEPSHNLLGKRLILERQAFKNNQCTLQSRWQNQLVFEIN